MSLPVNMIQSSGSVQQLCHQWQEISAPATHGGGKLLIFPSIAMAEELPLDSVARYKFYPASQGKNESSSDCSPARGPQFGHDHPTLTQAASLSPLHRPPQAADQR